MLVAAQWAVLVAGVVGFMVAGPRGRHHVFEDGVEQLARLLGITIREELHRALEIREEHGHLLALAFEGGLGGEDLLSEVLGCVHATFAGFREEIKAIVADDDRVVVHFTITGTHTGPWGPVPASGRPVAFDEIVIMTVRDSKVVHQTGVIDNVTGLRQVGVLPAART